MVSAYSGQREVKENYTRAAKYAETAVNWNPNDKNSTNYPLENERDLCILFMCL